MKKERRHILRITFVLALAAFLVAGNAFSGVVFAHLHTDALIVDTQFGTVEGFLRCE